MGPTSQAVRHVFVLMLENRSFDHMLGYSGITGSDAATGQPTQLNGLAGTESNNYNGKTYPVSPAADYAMLVDPGHDFTDVLKQLCGPAAVYPPEGPTRPSTTVDSWPPTWTPRRQPESKTIRARS